MKRRIISLLLAALLVTMAAASHADENTQETVVRMAQGLLTEVYGYTQEEAEGFTYDISEGDGVWAVRFSQNPAWAYEAEIDQGNMKFTKALTPFATTYRVKAAENAVRGMLNAIEDNGWFDHWNGDGKTAFGEATVRYEIRMNVSMERGLQTDAYTPAQALDDVFLSCYGYPAQWSPELLQWRDAVFAAFGLARETAAVSMPQGITEYTTDDMGADGSTICEFTGEVPDALAQAFSHPKLQGWVCLAGAYQVNNKISEDDSLSGAGLAAFGRRDQRLLVMLLQASETRAWKVLPVSETALDEGRELYISYGGSTGRFDIVYPVSDTEMECFQCRLIQTTSMPAYPMMCGLERYWRIDTSTNTMFEVNPGTNYGTADWYRTVTTQNGVETEAQYPALNSSLMEYIDASVFPRTEEACREAAEASPALPEGYGFSSHVHLRAKATSHSNDLGMYQSGTLVQVLDEQPGMDHPWYHVRIGAAEGYMSGNYVTYSKEQPSIMRYAALSVGKLKSDTALKQGTGLFAGTVQELPAGTVVRVLAETGNWLHVSVPPEEYGWLMQPGEVNGYIKNNAVIHGTTPLQLSWLTPED